MPLYVSLLLFAAIIGSIVFLFMRSSKLHDARDRFFTWAGGLDVFELDPSTTQWTRLTGTGDDPGAQLTNGTYGRLRYSPRYDVLVLLNGSNADVSVFRLP